MSLELLDQLEERVQNTLDTIELLQMELEEERQRSAEFEQGRVQAVSELQAWRSKVESLLGKLSYEEDEDEELEEEETEEQEEELEQDA